MGPTLKTGGYMSPTFKKHVCRCAATTLTALALWNCSNDSSSSDTEATGLLGETANVAFNLDYAETPLLDSIVLDCYGTDTIHLVHSADIHYTRYGVSGY